MRQPDPFDRKSLLGSLGVHAVALSAAVFASVAPRQPAQFVTYQIEMVSPPPARKAAEAQPEEKKLVVERPTPTPPAEEKPAPVVKPQPAKPKPKPVEKPAERSETAKPDTPAETKDNKAATSPDAAESKSKESGEGINVRIEGLKRDYPAYYGNIIRQIDRCFRWNRPGQLVATIYFVIKKDGTVEDMSIARRSGDPTFDIAAMGAVECAGKGRFGALPEELPYDRLPIQFTFRPPGGGDHAPLGPDNRHHREQGTSR